MSIIKYERLSDAKEIQSWAHQHKAEPAEKELADGETELTFNVGGRSDADPLGWDQFLERFKSEGFELLVEPDGSSSNYFKVINTNEENAPIEVGPSVAQDLTKKVQNSDFRIK